MKNNLLRRMFTALVLILCVTTALQIPVFATSQAAQNELSGMYTEAMKWYKLLVTIIIPALIVRLASYGFMILGSAFLSESGKQMDKIKQDILYTFLAVIVLLLIPPLISWANGFMKANAWKPHAVTTGQATTGGIQQ